MFAQKNAFDFRMFVRMVAFIVFVSLVPGVVIGLSEVYEDFAPGFLLGIAGFIAYRKIRARNDG